MLIRAIWTYTSVALSICTHDLLNVTLLLASLLLFHSVVIVRGKGVFIKLTHCNVVLNLNELLIHCHDIHTAHDRLARVPVEMDIVVRAVLVLVVEEGTLRQADFFLGALIVRVIDTWSIRVEHLVRWEVDWSIAVGVRARIEVHRLHVWLRLVHWNEHRVAARMAVHIMWAIWCSTCTSDDNLGDLALRVHRGIHTVWILDVL